MKMTPELSQKRWLGRYHFQETAYRHITSHMSEKVNRAYLEIQNAIASCEG